MALALIIAIMGGAALLIGVRHRRPGLMLLGASVVVCHALPLACLDVETMPATMRAYFGPAIAIAGIASFAWCIGYWLFARGEDVPEVVRVERDAPSHLLHRVVIVVLAGLISAAPGGVFGFAQSGFLRLPVDSTLFSLTYATACLAAFTTTLVCIDASFGKSRPPWFSIGVVLLVFWLLGGRTQLAITAMTYGMVFFWYGRVRLRGLLLPGLALGTLAAMTLSFRLTLQGEATGLAEAVPLMLSQLSLLEGYGLAARFAEEFGYQGWHYWETMQQILPRALFPAKPLQLSKALRLMEARDTLGGLTPGLAGEAFAAAGLVGLAGIGTAFGGALALLDNGYRSLSSHPPITQALIVSLIPLLAIFALRGGFDTAIFRLVILGFAGALAVLARRQADPARVRI